MKVKQLEELIGIWKLVEKDPSITTIILDATGVQISGKHIGATKDSKLPLDRPMQVSGERMVGSIKLFSPTAVVKIKNTEVSLILNAGKRRAVLQTAISEKVRREEPVKTRRFRGKRLRDAVPFFRGCIAGGVMKPILTGIQFTRNKSGKIVLEATDGETRCGRQILSIPLNASGQVVPAVDLEQALSLMEGAISMTFRKSHLFITDGSASIKLAILSGKYPNTRRMRQEKYKHKITLKRSHLDTAVQAAILFDSDRLVRLSIRDGQAAWLVLGQETGAFRQPIGKVKLPDTEIMFDANWLEAGKHLGTDITMQYTNPKSIVLFKGNKRSLWLSTIVR